MVRSHAAFDDGLLRRVRASGGLLMGPETDAGLLEGARRTDDRITGGLIVPLVSRDTLVGVLAVYSVQEDWRSTPENLRFLSALASHASVALQNARLVARTEELNRDLERKVRERTARLRRAFDELQELDRLKDDFLSSISHELLTPLTSICSFTEILQTGEQGVDRDSAEEFLGIIHQEADRLTQRVRLLLDVSRIEAGKGYGTKGVRVENDRWIHVAAVKAGPVLSLYVNGEPRGSVAVPEHVASGALDFAIGANPHYTGANECLDGLVDDFAFHAQALTADEIRNAFQAAR